MKRTPLRMLPILVGLLFLSLAPFAQSALAASSPPQGPPRAIRDNVAPYTAIPDNVPPSITFAYPDAPAVATMWIGELTTGCNARVGPGAEYATDRSWQKGRRVLVYASKISTTGTTWYQVESYPNPELYVWGECVRAVAGLQVAPQKHKGKWIDVNLTQQTLIAFEGDKSILATQVSTGKPGHETPTGSWRIIWRLKVQDMDGGGKLPNDPYYNMKDVPWVQYFHNDGDALHGAYWHDNFGTPLSHGCVNLSYQDSNWLYLWDTSGTYVEVHY